MGHGTPLTSGSSQVENRIHDIFAVVGAWPSWRTGRAITTCGFARFEQVQTARYNSLLADAQADAPLLEIYLLVRKDMLKEAAAKLQAGASLAASVCTAPPATLMATAV